MLLTVSDIYLPSTVTDSSTAGLGVGTVGLWSLLLLPKASFHFDDFLVTVGVDGTVSLRIGGTGGTIQPMVGSSRNQILDLHHSRKCSVFISSTVSLNVLWLVHATSLH